MAQRLTEEQAEALYERQMDEAEANAAAEIAGEPIPFPGKEEVERRNAETERVDPRDELPKWMDFDEPEVHEDEERGFTVLQMRVKVPSTSTFHTRKFSKFMSRERRLEGQQGELRTQLLNAALDMPDEEYEAIERRIEELSAKIDENTRDVVCMLAPDFPRERWHEVPEHRRERIAEYVTQCLYADVGARQRGPRQEGDTDPNSSTATSEQSDAG